MTKKTEFDVKVLERHTNDKTWKYKSVLYGEGQVYTVKLEIWAGNAELLDPFPLGSEWTLKLEKGPQQQLTPKE
jgi:hypothetical protein